MKRKKPQIVVACTYDENGESAKNLIEQFFRTFIEIELRKTEKNRCVIHHFL